MENENIQLQAQIQHNVQESKETDDKTMELLNILDEVMTFYLSQEIAH
jgi:hypothetical protein